MTRRLFTRSEFLLPARMIMILFVLIYFKGDANAALSSYTFTSVTGVALEDTVGTTQLIGTNADNTVAGVSAVTNIGFTFNFNGIAYTQFSVNENGLLRLGSVAVSVGSTAANSLAASTDLPKITAYFDDLKTVTGTVRYKVMGSSPNRKLVVQWNVTINGPNSTNSKFQVWLNETSGNVSFVYGQNMVLNSAQYSVGMVGTSTADFQSVTTSSNTSSISVVNNANTTAITSGQAYLFSIPPVCTTTPSPAASATNININPTLSWVAGAGYNNGYDVYFGTTSTPPRVSYKQAATTFSPGTLSPGTVYWWKVNPRNDSAAASCTAIQFTTAIAPGCTTTPSPAANATNVSPTATLSWVAGSGATTGYDVYFGTAPSPPVVSSNQVGTTYNPGPMTPGTIYYWKVVPINNGASNSSCSILQFTTTPAPGCANITAPSNGGTNIPTNQTLTWTAGSGTTTGYDVYFGTAASPPLVSTNQATLNYAPVGMTNGTTYNWKIVPRNGTAFASGCSTNTFTTASAPGCTTNPSPAASATNVALTPTLSWTAGSGVTTGYDVYFGTLSTPGLVSTNQAGTTYTPAALTAGTVYYWRVVPRNGSLIATCNTVLSFTTMSAPGCTTSPSPAAGATNVAVSGTTLSWTAGSGTTTGYNVYFGNIPSPPLVSTNQAGTTYSPGGLNPNTIYYWKVLPSNGSLVNNTCTAISFTTSVPPSCPNYVSPASAATNVNYYNCTLTWTSGSTNTTGYDVYLGTAPGPGVVSTNQPGTSYSANLSPNTTYYWKVIAHNGSILSTGCSEQSFTTTGLINYDVNRSTGISFTSIASTGNTVSSWKNGANTDDNLSNSVPIGFNFTYAGRTVSNFLVSTNGFITFNTATSATGGSSTPYGYTDDALSNYYANASTLVLAPMYNDMVCQGNSNLPSGLAQSIHYSLNGSAPNRILTVEWTGMELYVSAGPDLNFQIKLYETSNNIEFVYGRMDGYNGTYNTGYSFSAGLNSGNISNPPIAGEVFNQITINTRNFGVTPANTQIMIPDCNSKLTFTPGNYTPYVAPATAPPVNDNVANAITLPVNSSPCIDLCGTIYTSANATNSLIAPCSSSIADDDVWFKFTATNQNTTIKVISSVNYDGTVQLFDNGMVSLACGNATGVGLTEIINASLTAGQNYFVRVYHKGSGSGSGNTGQFSICISATPPPPVNDNCANRINLTVTQSPVFSQGTSTYSATASAGIPVCSVAGTNPDDDVWYSFTAVNTTEVVTVAGGVGFDAVLQVLNGTCNSLNPLVCVDQLHNGQTESVTLNNLVRNASYTVRVYHEGVGGGSGNFQIAVSSPPPACVQAMAPGNGDIDIPTFGTDLFWDSVPGADNYRIVFDTVFPPVRVLGVTTDMTINTGPLFGGKTYYWRVETGNATGFNSGCQVFHFATESTPINLTLRVFLEGYYTGNQTMLPLVNPLDTITDTITISLADSTRNIVYSQNINLGTHGWATAHFPLGVFEENWYLVIDQRNSLEIWSNGMFGIFSADTSYDFTNSATKTFGGNQKLLAANVYGMYIGDLNQDGVINADDMPQLIQDSQIFDNQIKLGDINGDGAAESQDCSVLENKFPLNLSVMIP
jgi:hypothetical protein